MVALHDFVSNILEGRDRSISLGSKYYLKVSFIKLCLSVFCNNPGGSCKGLMTRNSKIFRIKFL